MAQVQVERPRVGPPDAQWIQMQDTDNEELQSLGEFAVNEHNQKSDGGNMNFGKIFVAWEMSLAPDADRIYQLHLIASGPEGQPPAMIQAFVWKTAGGPRIFMSSTKSNLEIRCNIL